MSGKPPEATFTIKGSGTVLLLVRAAHGALLRSTPGLTRVVLTGDDAPLGVEAALPSEVPSSAIADLTVRYDGIRLLETVSDAGLPGGPYGGAVVTAAGTTRALPPAALDGRVV